jgi:hypothetical protein
MVLGYSWVMQKRKLPRDINARAAMIVAMSTGQAFPEPESKNSVAAASGKLGGKARAQSLSKRKRAEIAKLAAAARWRKSEN